MPHRPQPQRRTLPRRPAGGLPTRRSLLLGGAALLGSSLLAGCDRLSNAPWFRHVLDKDEDANLYVQRLLLRPAQLAPEYTAADLSPWFKPNGTQDPPDADYKALAKAGFASFKLVVDGLVERPQSLSLAELRAMPSRTQITRHDCVEGWSCIGGWTGVPLAAVLQRAGLKPAARFVVFHCADTMDGGDQDDGGSDDGDQTRTDQDDDTPDAGQAGTGSANPNMTRQPNGSGQHETTANAPANGSQAGDSANSDDTSAASGSRSAEGLFNQAARNQGTPDQPAGHDLFGSGDAADSGDQGGSAPVRYYESLDLEDAFHPQTILAYAMNGKPLPVEHGAPLRVRVERQLGYKMAKYVMRIEVVDTLATIGGGNGGYWEDQGYEWYAGI